MVGCFCACAILECKIALGKRGPTERSPPKLFFVPVQDRWISTLPQLSTHGPAFQFSTKPDDRAQLWTPREPILLGVHKGELA